MTRSKEMIFETIKKHRQATETIVERKREEISQLEGFLIIFAEIEELVRRDE